MTDLLATLEASTFSTWLRESPSVWAYPTVLTLHTLGLGVLVGTNWMVDLRVLGFGRAIPLGVLARAFPIMWAGFWVNAATGVLLMMALKRRVYGRGVAMDSASTSVKWVAAVSLLLWVAAIGTGRWMAYVSAS